jgi:hypothetical protein
MLSNKEAAQQVEKAARLCLATCNGSIRRVMETCPDGEFQGFRRTVGLIMGSLCVDVLMPINRSYPELQPEEFKPQGGNCQ